MVLGSCVALAVAKSLIMEVGGGYRRAMEGRFVPMLPLWGPETGRAVMSRELAKDEEVTLPGSRLCRGLRDPVLSLQHST